MGHTMNHRTVRRLTDLEIDEVSLVDRPANQHGLVAFAKAYEEDSMGIYDAAGDEVYEDELKHGDFVYDDAGNEFQFVDDAADSETYEGELVGKADEASRGRLNAAMAFGGTHGLVAGKKGHKLRAAGNEVGGSYAGATPGYAAMAHGAKRGSVREMAAGYAGAVGGSMAGSRQGAKRAQRMGHFKEEASKSLGQSVYEELSKALTSDDRDVVISKAMERVSKAEERAEYLEQVVSQLADRAELDEFIEIAKGYALPVHPERLGRILKSAAATMDDEDLAELDRLLTAQGSMYEALGSDLSGQDSEIHSQIEALALETVGKADISFERATVAVYEANPAAYDEYLAESR